VHGDALPEKKGVGGSIVKLTTIIALETFNGATKLSANISKEE
jgi:hypothetical protein